MEPLVIGTIGREDGVSTDAGLKDEARRFRYASFNALNEQKEVLPPALHYQLKSLSEVWFYYGV